MILVNQTAAELEIISLGQFIAAGIGTEQDIGYLTFDELLTQFDNAGNSALDEIETLVTAGSLLIKINGTVLNKADSLNLTQNIRNRSQPDKEYVELVGNQQVDGVKTFLQPPEVGGSAFAGNQIPNASYVDAAVNAISGGYASPVQTIQNLRDIPASQRQDKQLRLVEDSGAIFRYDAQGTGADDGAGTIVPADNPATGRWFKTQSATQDHEQLLGLQGGAPNDHQHLTTAEVAQLPSSAEKAALAGTDGSPGAANKYVTNSDPRLLPLSVVPGATAPTDTSGKVLWLNQATDFYATLMLRDNTRAKWLSVDEKEMLFGHDNARGAYLRLPGIRSPGNRTAYLMPKAGTIVGIAARSRNGSGATFQIRINGTVATGQNFTLDAQGKFIDNTRDLDFAKGDDITVRATNAAAARDVEVVLFYRWRG